MDRVLYDLKNVPFSRRIMTTTWTPMTYNAIYNVTNEPTSDNLTLNMVSIQHVKTS